MPGKIICLSAALFAFIGFGNVTCFAQTKFTEFDAVDTYVICLSYVVRSRLAISIGVPRILGII